MKGNEARSRGHGSCLDLVVRARNAGPLRGDKASDKQALDEAPEDTLQTTRPLAKTWKVHLLDLATVSMGVA